MKRISLWIFIIAFCARAAVTAVRVFQNPTFIPWFPTLALWSDFHDVYGQQLNLLGQGLVPYRDFAYSYTPLFLYALFPFYLLGGVQAASIPILISDAGTAPIVYLLVRSSSSERIALFAGLAYALSPFFLLEEGYLLLSNQPVVFFLMLTIYFTRSNRPLIGSVAYGLAILFKQDALFVLPVLVAWQVLKYGRQAWKGLSLLGLVVFAGSMPFLFVSAVQYVQELSYGLLGTWHPVGVAPLTSGGNNFQTSASGLIELRPCSSTPLTQSGFSACLRFPNPVLTFLITSFGWISDTIVLPFLVLTGAAIFFSKQRGKDVELLLSFSFVCFLTLFSLVVHVVYAYYFVPFYALLLASSRTRLGIVVSLLASTIGMITSAGSFQVAIALISVLVITVAQDQLQQALRTTPGSL